MLRTKRVIDSSLALVFAEAAVNRQLNELALVAGGNPFEYMAQYDIAHPAYLGELDHDPTVDNIPGWYYLTHRRQVVYKARYLETDSYYEVILKFEDVNQSGSFEASTDKFRNLHFVRAANI